MSLPDDYLRYPRRRYGMDHDRYAWSMLSERAPVEWPGGAKLALWVNVNLQFFPLNQAGKPFKVPGGMTMPYPDLRHYSLRDYGNRIGVFRIMDALDRFGVRPTFAVNGRLAERYPALVREVVARGDEIIAYGWHMDALHHEGLSEAEESALIERTVGVLREMSGQPVTGWLSPARNESTRTPDLVARHGIEYLCDWVNDDMPYPFRVEGGTITALPLSNELDDFFILQSNLHSEDSYVEQIEDAADLLLAEAASQGGRLLALNVHPWLLGQPHRIARFERLLESLTGRDGVWSASAGEIVASWRAQQAQ
jgi:peptidoglycan/xylan/chitin deacetylase (PgdA/CDA1 family)